MKHTSGEWVFNKFTPCDFGVYSTTANRGRDIALIRGSDEEAEANAKLIASAPTMLKALQSANNYFVDLQNKCALTNSDERAWKLISKAIYEATE